MRILYIANIRIPTEKAHGIQIMKMCEAFGMQGVEVELVVPWRFNHIKDNPFVYYGVVDNFKIKKVFSVDLVKFGKIGFWVQSVSFAVFSFLYAVSKKVDVIYSRDELPLFFLGLLNKNIVYEAHTPRFNFIIKRFNKIIAISNGLKQFYLDKGVSGNKIIVAHDAVDIKEFDIDVSKEEAREKLNLPLYKKIILYTGHLYSWKGVDTLAESSKYLSKDKIIVFVGGVNSDVVKFKEKYKDVHNILILGQKPHKEIAYYLKSADVLVLPNSAKSNVSRLYTSPMKLFEYMASGTSIVASDLPSIREVLNEENSTLVEADNPRVLASEIKLVLNKDNKKALEDVRQYTWENRVLTILKYLKK